MWPSASKFLVHSRPAPFGCLHCRSKCAAIALSWPQICQLHALWYEIWVRRQSRTDYNQELWFLIGKCLRQEAQIGTLRDHPAFTGSLIREGRLSSIVLHCLWLPSDFVITTRGLCTRRTLHLGRCACFSSHHREDPVAFRAVSFSKIDSVVS
jgi:hypothetical protein